MKIERRKWGAILTAALFARSQNAAWAFQTSKVPLSQRPGLTTSARPPTSLHVFGFGAKPSPPKQPAAAEPSPGQVVRAYFDCWNERDMAGAVAKFAEDCVYEDTLYPETFTGREELRFHLLRVAAALPASFEFVVDELAEDPATGKVGVQWHVEADGRPLPFTRGASMYTVRAGRISRGFDVPEPALKSGSASLALLSGAKNLIADPARAAPLAAWALYCYGLFLSDWLPGPNALALDPATWQEVLGLSTNFWLILPLLAPADAPVLNPVLEAVFNLVLAWAALFGGFLVDGRRSQPPVKLVDGRVVEEEGANAMLAPVLGMQFLTNAFLLPYLVAREAEADKSPAAYARPLSAAERAAESKALPLLLAAVAALALGWGAWGRAEAYGDLAARWADYAALLAGDRLGASFWVDLALFWAFQGWLLPDDLRRREAVGEGEWARLAAVGRGVPLFGLAYYLLARPPLRVPAAAGEEEEGA
ncbi:unnamed protein product [Heterosigma akashiwo]